MATPMALRCKSIDLQAAVIRLSEATRHQTNEQVLLRARQGILVLCVTTPDFTIRTHIPANVEMYGRFVVPLEWLRKVVETTSGTLALRVEQPHLIMQWEQSIRERNTSRLIGTSAYQLPAVARVDARKWEALIGSDQLQAALRRVLEVGQATTHAQLMLKGVILHWIGDSLHWIVITDQVQASTCLTLPRRNQAPVHGMLALPVAQALLHSLGVQERVKIILAPDQALVVFRSPTIEFIAPLLPPAQAVWLPPGPLRADAVLNRASTLALVAAHAGQIMAVAQPLLRLRFWDRACQLVMDYGLQSIPTIAITHQRACRPQLGALHAALATLTHSEVAIQIEADGTCLAIQPIGDAGTLFAWPTYPLDKPRPQAQPLQTLVAQLRYDPPPGPAVTDLTDAQWARVSAVLLTHTTRRGRPRLADRSVLNAILSKLFTGRPWAKLPGGHTSRRRLEQWLADGTWQAIEDAVMNTPAQAGSQPRRLLTGPRAPKRRQRRRS